MPISAIQLSILQETLTFGWVLDVVLVALYFFLLFMLAKRYNARFFLALTAVVSCLALFATLVSLVVIKDLARWYFLMCGLVFLILYGDEIKRDIMLKSTTKRSGEVAISPFKGTPEELKIVIEQIIRACQNMSRQNIGALIVIVPTSIPIQIARSGTIMDAQVSSQLLESTFFPKSPLHDGAMLVSGNRIFAGGCLLPLTQDLKIPKELGTRHRAGIGITERTDALSIIVSEETGIISLSRYGKLLRFADFDSLNIALAHVYGLTKTDGGIFGDE